MSAKDQDSLSVRSDEKATASPDPEVSDIEIATFAKNAVRYSTEEESALVRKFGELSSLSFPTSSG